MEKITNVIRVRIEWRLQLHWMHVKCQNLYHYEPHRIAVIMGTSAGAILEIEENSEVAFQFENNFPFMGFHSVDTHTLSDSVAEAIGSCGPSFTLTTGCTASIDASIDGKTST